MKWPLVAEDYRAEKDGGRGQDEDVAWGKRQQEKAVPVGVCVGGEEATVGRVYEMVKRGTPVLICRGTGKAADLLADVIWMHQSVGGAGEKWEDESASRQGSVMSSEEHNKEGGDDGAGAGLWESEDRQRVAAEVLARGHGSATGASDEWIIEEASKVYGLVNRFKCVWLRTPEPQTPHHCGEMRCSQGSRRGALTDDSCVAGTSRERW